MLVQQQEGGCIKILGVGPTKYQKKVAQWQQRKEDVRNALVLASIIAFWLYVWCVTP